jgi:hypothetical protein
VTGVRLSELGRQQTEFLQWKATLAVQHGILLSTRLGRQRAPGERRIQVAVCQPGSFFTVGIEAATRGGVAKGIVDGPKHVVLVVAQVRVRLPQAVVE